jgi:PKD repeat protein
VKINFGDDINDLSADFKTESEDFYHVPGETINFDASISKGDIVDYIWDFGDGTYGTGMNPEYTYNDGNNYFVILIVRDNGGNIDRKTEILYVQDTDADKLPDEWEDKYFGGTSAILTVDDDKDGLNNKEEYLHNTNPGSPDTDGDGINDKEEIDKGYDPLDPKSTPPEEKDEDDGFLGLGKFAGIDVLYWVLILVILIVVILAVVGRRGRKVQEEIEEEEEEMAEEKYVEEAEEEEEFGEEYECPECGEVIYEDQPECSSCGATLEWD